MVKKSWEKVQLSGRDAFRVLCPGGTDSSFVFVCGRHLLTAFLLSFNKSIDISKGRIHNEFII